MSAKKVVGGGAAKYRPVMGALLLSNGLSLILYLIRVADTGSYSYWFLIWNLLLAWVPLAIAFWLDKRLRKYHWFSWQNILLTLLWLGFLPNSFYLISDLVHLSGYKNDVLGIFGGFGAASAATRNLLYDVVMLSSFIWNGLLLGFSSVYLIHRQLLRRLTEHSLAHWVIAMVLLLCSFAIYLGRNLRWNTWDVLVNPAGLLFDVSDRFINPAAHPQAFITTATFFALISTMYFVIWQLIVALRSDRS